MDKKERAKYALLTKKPAESPASLDCFFQAFGNIVSRGLLDSGLKMKMCVWKGDLKADTPFWDG